MARHGTRARIALAVALASSAISAAAANRTPTLVFCAPGSPGTTEEAQGAMNAFASAVAERAALESTGLAATYAAGEDAGVARIRKDDAAVAIVSLPFFLEHEKALGLRSAGLQPVTSDAGGAQRRGTEEWSLVAARGRIKGAAALDGFTIVSTAGYSPSFVRAALGTIGELPRGVQIAPTTAVLSALRRAAAGEPLAVLLDGAQAAALPGLALSKDLEVVARSEPFPVGIVATVERRLAPGTWRRIEEALRTLHESPAGAHALAGIRVARFEPLDEAALARARRPSSGARP